MKIVHWCIIGYLTGFAFAVTSLVSIVYGASIVCAVK